MPEDGWDGWYPMNENPINVPDDTHGFEETRDWWVDGRVKYSQYRCIRCKRFIGTQIYDYCVNPRCEVPILQELIGVERTTRDDYDKMRGLG